MSQRIFLPLLLAAFLLLSGCSLVGNDEADSQRRIIDGGATSVDVASTSQHRVSFDFKGRLPVPCYEFKEALVDQEEHRVTVKVRAQSTADYCVTATGVLRVRPLDIEVPSPGTYTFAFWRGKETEPLVVQADVP